MLTRSGNITFSKSNTMSSPVKTRVLLMSDTHGQEFDRPLSLGNEKIDVVIHCGDLTEHSKLGEFETTLRLFFAIDAPLKLVIPGNHDWWLDTHTHLQAEDSGSEADKRGWN